MDNIANALLEDAFHQYEEKQRLNLEVLRTMIQTVCKRISGDSKKDDFVDRLGRLEQMITKIHDGEGRIIPKTPILTALSMINSSENHVKHIHLQERAPIQEEQVIDELVLNEPEEEAEEAAEEAEEETEEAEEADAEADAEEEELELEEFTWKGKTYYKDGDENVYDLNDDGEPEKIGTYKEGKILLDSF